MNKFNRKHLIGFITLCLAGFIVPFITRTETETANTIISTAFTIVSTIVAIITLVVGIILFDKYGVNAIFKEKQVDVVLQLINELKLLNLSVSGEEYRYSNYIRHCNNLENMASYYQIDKTKILIFPENHESLMKPIYNLLENVWLPSEIKEKTKFLQIFMTRDNSPYSNSNFVKLEINNSKTEIYVETIPKLTFEMFSINLSNFIQYTLLWVKEHTHVDIDFDLINSKH